MSWTMRSVVGLMLLATSTASWAEETPQSVDISVLGGIHAFERTETTNREAFQLNLRVGYNINEWFGIEAGADWAFPGHHAGEFVTAQVQDTYLDVVDLSLDLLVYLIHHGPFIPYVGVGPGVTVYKDGIYGLDGRESVNFAVGAKFDVASCLALRLDGRLVNDWGPLPATTVKHDVSFYATIGFDFVIGRNDYLNAHEAAPVAPAPVVVAPTPEPASAPVVAPAPAAIDSDGDGVPDSDDACPNEPGPATQRGCPTPQVAPVPAAAPSATTPSATK